MGTGVNLLDAFNSEVPDKAFGKDVGWKPSLYAQPPLAVGEVAAYVKAHAGPGKLK